MRGVSIRSLTAALASVIAVLAVAAAPAPGSSSPAAVLTDAAARLANASSYHAEVRSRLSVGSEAMKMNGGLDVDVKHNELNGTLSVGVVGESPVPMRMVLSHGKLYLNADFFKSSSAPKGSKPPWVLLDLNQLAGFDSYQLKALDPSSDADHWTKVAKQTRLTTQHNGSVTVISCRVSLKWLADVYRHNSKWLSGLGGQQTLHELEDLKVGDITYQFRIERGYLVHIAMVMHYTDPASGPVEIDTSFGLSGYGKRVKVETPDARQTITLEQLQQLGS
jgi:hypothetical protein